MWGKTAARDGDAQSPCQTPILKAKAGLVICVLLAGCVIVLTIIAVINDSPKQDQSAERSAGQDEGKRKAELRVEQEQHERDIEDYLRFNFGPAISEQPWYRNIKSISWRTRALQSRPTWRKGARAPRASAARYRISFTIRPSRTPLAASLSWAKTSSCSSRGAIFHLRANDNARHPLHELRGTDEAGLVIAAPPFSPPN